MTAAADAALRRRVLLTGFVTLALFTAAAFVIAVAKASDAYLLLSLVVIYLLVIRPLLAPVRAANRHRKALAYQAFLDSRRDGQEGQ